jgi:3-oxoacyl-[acyl-carrier protein] reductase
MTVEGKTIVITGAGSGIGGALAVGFSKDGALVVGFDISRDGLSETAAACAGEFVSVEGDVTLPDDVDRLVSVALGTSGRIDALINNAGIAAGVFTEEPFERWQRVIDVNLNGVALCTHRVLPVMMKQGHGRIISVISRAAEGLSAGNNAYAASKAGATTLMKTLAASVRQTGHHDILVNSMVPGPTKTPIWAPALTDSRLAEYVERMQEPQAVYPHARFLVELPPDGPTGRVFWNSEEYPIYTRFND